MVPLFVDNHNGFAWFYYTNKPKGRPDQLGATLDAERRMVFQHGPKMAQDIPRRAAHDSTNITQGEPTRYQCGRNQDSVSKPC